MWGKYSSEPMIEKIVNNKKYKILLGSEILQIVKMNSLVLLKILKLMGQTKEEIFENLRMPEEDIKEILYEFNYGSKQVKKYCPN